jgi:protocatechuate 3,4-dioxygenase beta subunit
LLPAAPPTGRGANKTGDTYMDNDDVMSPIVGRRQILRRAGMLGLVGLGLTTLAPRSSALQSVAELDEGELDVSDLLDDASLQAVCSMTPSNALGPYWLNLNLVRSNITEGLPGVKTRIFINVVRASDCAPVPNATVDVWHTNALGAYSGFAGQGTAGQTFLRGVQFTDANGSTYFDTIFPGWYPGRTAHIHAIVRPTPTTQLTTQLFFNQVLINRVYGRPPYSTHGPASTTNTQDGLYNAAVVMTNLGYTPANGLQLELTIGVA